MRKEHMYFVGLVGLFLLSGLFKQKACQNSDSGDLSARPWYWPCPTGSYTTKSASTD
jgi:hypothetical protein